MRIRPGGPRDVAMFTRLITLAAPPHEQRDEIVRQLLDADARIVSTRPAMTRDASVEVLVPREDDELVSIVTVKG